jgi:hypothetical protein
MTMARLPGNGEIALGPVRLPAGRRVISEDGEIVAWVTEDAVAEPGRVWAALQQVHTDTGLVPVLLDPEDNLADFFFAGGVDTSIIAALRLFDPAELPDTILITAVTLGELSFGPHATDDPVKRAGRVAVLQHVEATFDPLPYDQGAARPLRPDLCCGSCCWPAIAQALLRPADCGNRR